jgi:hypothetical protein
MWIGRLLPFVDPGEAMPAALGRLPDRGGDGGRLQPIEPGLEAFIVAEGVAATDESEDFVRRRGHQARGAEAAVARVNDLRGCPDQHVGIPDGRHAVLGHGFDANNNLASVKNDGNDTLGFGK